MSAGVGPPDLEALREELRAARGYIEEVAVRTGSGDPARHAAIAARMCVTAAIGYSFEDGPAECSTCAFFRAVEVERGRGECRRRSPRTSGTTYAPFPSCMSDDWCGEYRRGPRVLGTPENGADS